MLLLASLFPDLGAACRKRSASGRALLLRFELYGFPLGERKRRRLARNLYGVLSRRKRQRIPHRTDLTDLFACGGTDGVPLEARLCHRDPAGVQCGHSPAVDFHERPYNVAKGDVIHAGKNSKAVEDGTLFTLPRTGFAVKNLMAGGPGSLSPQPPRRKGRKLARLD